MFTCRSSSTWGVEASKHFILGCQFNLFLSEENDLGFLPAWIPEVGNMSSV